MAYQRARPTGRESPFDENEIIVSKTDPRGRITYVNDVFGRVSQFGIADLLGQPHNVIRHPDMPRCVFKLMWDTIQAKQEIFAYVLNLAKTGDHYWVFAHVTPTLNAAGAITGYHSNRRKPDPPQVAKIATLYHALLAEEQRHADPKQGLRASGEALAAELRKRGMTYDAFVFSL
jgi:PAS domain S-box-containing protein